PLLAQSGHPPLHRTCPLLGVKRTWKALQHSRQIRTPRRALVIPTECCLLRAVGGDLIQPVDDLPVAATVIDQTQHLIATGTATLVARHPKLIELADKVAEDDCAVAGHVCAALCKRDGVSVDIALT